jgi:hypothetical protein
MLVTRCNAAIPANAFLLEYVGEVISGEECRARMSRERKRAVDANEAPNFYFMTIGDGSILDASSRGGLGRFANHSCVPNCRVEKWSVNDKTRIAFFSERIVPPEEELTIDYQYGGGGGGGNGQECLCGARGCARTIGEKASTKASAIPLQISTEKASIDDVAIDLVTDDVCGVCGDGGELGLCDWTSEGRHCPRAYHAPCVDKTAFDRRTWICPYHFCDACAGAAMYMCHTCSHSACEDCWSRSRNAASASMHLTLLRPDLSSTTVVGYESTCCEQCQREPIVLREEERERYNAEHRRVVTAAIEVRRISDGIFGSGSADALYLEMEANSFTPKYVYTYWDSICNKPGMWQNATPMLI